MSGAPQLVLPNQQVFPALSRASVCAANPISQPGRDAVRFGRSRDQAAVLVRGQRRPHSSPEGRSGSYPRARSLAIHSAGKDELRARDRDSLRQNQGRGSDHVHMARRAAAGHDYCQDGSRVDDGSRPQQEHAVGGSLRRTIPSHLGPSGLGGHGNSTERKKGKGCDIGYALAASSCEGARGVEARTVTAFDAITAFAVPNPTCSSQSSRFFRVWRSDKLPCRTNHSAYFGLTNFV